MGKHVFRGAATSWDQIIQPCSFIGVMGIRKPSDSPKSNTSTSESSDQSVTNGVASFAPSTQSPDSKDEKQPASTSSVRKGISMEYSEQLARKYGFLPAPKDHPIYTEGTTISLVRYGKSRKRRK